MSNWKTQGDEEERLRHLKWGPDFNIMSDGRTNCAICGNNFLTTSRSRRCHECTDAARMRGVIDNLNDEVERLRAALNLADAIWPLAYRDVKASSAKDFADDTLSAWRAYDETRAALNTQEQT